MSTISWGVIATFAISMVFQTAGLLFMPASRGFTNPVPTLLCGGLFLIGIWLLARVTNAGVDLGIVLPLSAAVVPMCVMLAAIVIYHEPGSILRVALLIGASVLIGVASKFS